MEMKEKFNIFIFAPDFYPTNGGFANAITNFVLELSQHKKINKIIVFTPIKLKNNKELDSKKIVVIRRTYLNIFGTTFLTPFWWIRYVESLIRRYKISYIFYETGKVPVFGLLLNRVAKKYKIPFIVRVHASADTESIKFPRSFYERLLYFFGKKFYRSVENITATNTYHLEYIKSNFLDSNPFLIGYKNFYVIPNIIKSKSNGSMRENDRIKKEVLSYLSRYNVFFTLGRLDEAGYVLKGIVDLIYAVYLIKIREEKLLKNTKFLIVGRGNRKKFIESKIKKLKLDKHFVLYDYLSNKMVHFLQSRVTASILLSRSEGLSMFALEALYNGSPLLFTKVGGLVDLIEEGKNGYFVEPQNIEDIAKKLKMFLLLKKDEIEKMKKESKRIYKEKFDNKKTIERFIEFLEIIR